MRKEKNYELKNTKSVRLSDSSVKQITYIAKEENIKESEFIRSLLEKGIKKYRLKKALKLLKNKEITISNAAKISGLSYREFWNKMNSKGIKMDYSKEDLGKNVNKLLKLTKYVD